LFSARSISKVIRAEQPRSVDTENRYVLLVNWKTKEHHTVGFRGSPQYQEWRKLLHHFFDLPPVAKHYELI
jgi:heme-degrading monooxygenase HmoA